jgi:NTE family protein
MKDFSEHEWGLVLAGGGGKGAYQIGVFRALMEHRINDYITMVSGSSVGALNAVLFAYGDMKMATDLWEGISPKSFLQLSPDMFDLKEGLASRTGLTEIFDTYIDFEKVRLNEKTIYATVTDYGPEDMGNGVIKYYSLNYKPEQEIRDILLASSAFPILYAPIRINGNVCRDGGLTDNLPIQPLYIEGIRHFIVVGLSENTNIPYDKYPDAEFLLVKPEQYIGDLLDGTLDFSSKGAKRRIQVGYIDAVRNLEFYGEDMNSAEVRIRYDEAVRRDYNQLDFEEKRNGLSDRISRDFDKLNSLINDFMGE